MRVIGIDPGYDRCGVAIVEKRGSKEELLFSTCILTDKKEGIPERLLTISNEIEKIIKDFEPDRMALEKLFFNNNEKTAGAVGEARGVILLKSAEHKLPIFEYSPSSIKVAVTGYGKSDKKQVIFMVTKLLPVKKDIKLDDEYDAIAVALTCLASERP